MAKQQVDSIDNAKSAVYQVNGLAYASNISTVNKRDTAGNLEYREGEANPLLVIEPVAENIYTNSVIKVVNTQFSYFKFPATTTVESDDSFDLGIDPNDFIINLEELSEATAKAPDLPTRYRPTVDQQIKKSTYYEALEFSTVVEGQVQAIDSSFTITQEVLDTIATELQVDAVFKTYYYGNLDSELAFILLEYDQNGDYVGVVIDSLAQPTVGVKLDGNKPTKEGRYESYMDFAISKNDLTLGHTYRPAGRTDRQSNNRYHDLLAIDSYITYTAA